MSRNPLSVCEVQFCEEPFEYVLKDKVSAGDEVQQITRNEF